MMKKYPMKLRPVPKEILWGGDRLKKRYNKEAPFAKLAESWELTVRDDGMSVIDNGDYTGMTLLEYLRHASDALSATRTMDPEQFPLLIKFIDAHDDLSIQVHPDDEYARVHAHSSGKMEMWYIVEAEEGARLVYGLRDGCTAEDFANAVQSDRIEAVLRYVPVQAGECYFIPSGQIHAIGAGCLIAEIQQNCNITYRVFDYRRKQADGTLRRLHVREALDVVRVRTDAEVDAIRYAERPAAPELLCACPYFSVQRCVCTHDMDLFISDKSFTSLLVLHAEGGTLLCDGKEYELHTGDSYFLPAGLGHLRLRGSVTALASTV